MKKLFTSLIMLAMILPVYSTSYHTISVDGNNNGWTSDETFTDCSNADNAYLTWDGTAFYFGISDPEADYGNLATYMFIDTDPDGNNGTNNAYTWHDYVTTPFNADYVIVWKNNPGADYIEVRKWNSSTSTWDKMADATSTSLSSGNYVVSFAIGTDYREVGINFTTIDSPNAIKICSMTEQQWGSYYRYFTWPSSGWTDGNSVSGQSIPHYRGFITMDLISPTNANYYDASIYSWTGSTDNDWGTSTNWSGSSVPTTTDLIIISSGNPVINESVSSPAQCYDLTLGSSASLTINVNKALTVGNNFTNNGTAASIYIDSDNTGNGSLIVSGSVSGDVTVKRYIAAYTSPSDGWHEIGCPVTSFSVSGTDWDPTYTGYTNNDLYYYDETTDLWMNYRESAFDFVTEKGYLVANDADLNHSFTGTINVSDVGSISLSYTSSKGAGWNLLGNPYPSALTWNDANWTLTNVGGVAKVLNGSSGTYSDLNGGDIIPSTNGFFVQASAATSITIPAAARVHNSTNNYKQVQEENNKLKVKVSNDQNSYYNETVIGFKQKATNGWDIAFDSHKLFGYEHAPELWTISNDEMFSTNYLPFSTENIDVPLNFKPGVTGNYVLEFTGLDSFNELSDIYLEDLYLDKTVNLKNLETYEFDATVGDNSDRFVLHFYNVTATPEIGSENNTMIYAYQNSIIVKSFEKPLSGKVEVINLLGQTVYKQQISGTGFVSLKPQLENGAYIVRYRGNDGTVHSNKVIL